MCIHKVIGLIIALVIGGAFLYTMYFLFLKDKTGYQAPKTYHKPQKYPYRESPKEIIDRIEAIEYWKYQIQNPHKFKIGDIVDFNRSLARWPDGTICHGERRQKNIKITALSWDGYRHRYTGIINCDTVLDKLEEGYLSLSKQSKKKQN